MTEKIVLSIADDQYFRIEKSLSTYFGYVEFVVEDGKQVLNPETRKDFLIRELGKWVLGISRDVEINEAVKDVRIAAEETVKISSKDAQDLAAELSIEISIGK